MRPLTQSGGKRAVKVKGSIFEIIYSRCVPDSDISSHRLIAHRQRILI